VALEPPPRGQPCFVSHIGLFLAFAPLCAAGALAQVTITEFPVPTANSRPYTIVPGPDGNLWFTESNGNKIGRITPTGVITEFPVPTAQSGPYGITVGADGNIWFTERFGNQIARFTIASGQFTEFPIPTANSQPWEISLGRDGKLWFTEEDVNQIGRITSQGAITEFIPPSCCFPTGIGPGSDGRMWFTLEIGEQIGRVDPSGAMVMFTIPNIQCLPWDITPGPDGAVWFTELAGRSIGRISTAGQIVEFPIAGAFSGIAGVTAGPDGDIWFTENDTNHVGSIDTSGVVQHHLDTGNRPLSITLGPDGNLWFTEADENAIGRVDLAQPNEAHVLSLDAAFAPRLRAVTLGEDVQWTFLGPSAHSVIDDSGLGLFDSGSKRIVSYFVHTCDYAGTFVYRDGSSMAPPAAITVPVELPGSATVGVPFLVTWAKSGPPAGIVFDVQVRVPGSSTYADWQSGTQLAGNYNPTVAGVYRFRARMRALASGDTTLYSRPSPIVAH
jgi:virginiamycin B lyase